MKDLKQLVSVLVTCLTMSAVANGSSRTYEMWEPEPAPNNGRSQWERTQSLDRPNSYDRDWERWIYPLGNGCVGACVFGRTDAERIQIAVGEMYGIERKR